MEKLRPVEISKYNQTFLGKFHMFYQLVDGEYSDCLAVIESDDGHIDQYVRPDEIKFLDIDENKDFEEIKDKINKIGEGNNV